MLLATGIPLLRAGLQSTTEDEYSAFERDSTNVLLDISALNEAIAKSVHMMDDGIWREVAPETVDELILFGVVGAHEADVHIGC
jgi:hypothetical protein